MRVSMTHKSFMDKTALLEPKEISVGVWANRECRLGNCPWAHCQCLGLFYSFSVGWVFNFSGKNKQTSKKSTRRVKFWGNGEGKCGYLLDLVISCIELAACWLGRSMGVKGWGLGWGLDLKSGEADCPTLSLQWWPQGPYCLKGKIRRYRGSFSGGKNRKYLYI